MNTSNSSLKKAVVLGLMSGVRSTAGLLFIRSMVSHGTAASLPVQLLQKKPVNTGLAVLSVADVLADKIPNSTEFIRKSGPFLKAGAGAFCGALIYKAEGKKVVTGAAVGSLAAVASTYLFIYLRKTLWEKTKVARPLISATEEAAVSAAGMLVKNEMAV